MMNLKGLETELFETHDRLTEVEQENHKLKLQLKEIKELNETLESKLYDNEVLLEHFKKDNVILEKKYIIEKTLNEVKNAIDNW